MKLNDMDLFRVLPQFMRDDKNAQAFVYAIQSQLSAVSRNIEYAKVYSRIESMDETLLDELAWQFNVPEYDISYDLEVKRSIIKDCLIIHYKRGTVSAVKEVAEKIFGNAEISEWFEYGGQPYHFKVSTTNISSDDEMLAQFRKIIKETQNVRSHLEEVVVEVMNSMQLYAGCRMYTVQDVVELRTLGID